jgi:biopolymer transport protein ExbB/TolQ
VPVVSNEVRKSFQVAARPAAPELAFTGAPGSIGALVAAALGLVLAGTTVIALRRRPRGR